jgi:hypothetical protein
MERKIFLIVAIISLSIFSFGQNTNAVHNITMTPDALSVFDKASGPRWCSTTFFNYQGVLLMFSSSKFDGKQSKCYWGSRIYAYKQIKEEGTYSYELLHFGNKEYIEVDHFSLKTPVLFEFQNHLWISISRELVKFPKNFLEGTTGNLVYFDENSLVTNDDFVYKVIPQGDTLLNLFTIHEFPSAPEALHHKQAYLNSAEKFVVKSFSEIYLGNSFVGEDKLQDIIPYKDGFIINSLFDYKEQSYNSVVSYYNAKTKLVKQITSIEKCFESTIIKGSIEGKRKLVYGDKDCNERFTLFTISKIKNNGIYPINYYEYCMKGDNFEEVVSGSLHIPASITPSKIDYDHVFRKIFFLKSMYNYIPKTYTDLNYDLNNGKRGKDGLQQIVCLYYPTSLYSFVELNFNSDVWRPLSKDSFVTNNDLDDTAKYGENIRGLWTLAGILDGAPPCSIDWATWEQNNDLEYATNLTFSNENKTSTSFSIEHKDKFTTGLTISFGDEEKGGNAKLTAKYAHTWENREETATMTETKINQNFVLKEETQNQAYYLWSIPNILRATYQVYPWWGADSLKYPLDSTKHFMFRVNGTRLIQEAVNLSDYPFLIDNPNDSSMNDWHLLERNGLNDAQSFPGVYIGNISMPDNGNPGGTLEFYQEQEKTKTITVSNEVDIETEAGYSVPEVFSANVSVGNSYEWAKEYSISTSFGTGLEASLEKLYHNMEGLNVENLSLNVYYFQPRKDDEGWWFYDSVPKDQYPWYIAYAIPSSNAKISLLTPQDDRKLKSSDLLFFWESKNEQLSNYRFFVSLKPFFSQDNIVYEKNIDDETSINLANIDLEPDKTYYWRVSGIAETGETIFSKTKSFKTQAIDYFANKDGSIKASVYPNPISENMLNIAFSGSYEGKYSIKIFNMNGGLLYNSELFNESNVVSSLQVNITDFQSGIYMVVIQSGDSIYNNKLVVFH